MYRFTNQEPNKGKQIYRTVGYALMTLCI